MSCDCTRIYAGPTARDKGTLSTTGPTMGEGFGTPAPGAIIYPSRFCWKCFAFWGLVALVVLWLISDGREE